MARKKKQAPPKVEGAMDVGEAAQLADNLREVFSDVVLDGSGPKPVVTAKGHNRMPLRDGLASWYEAHNLVKPIR